MSIKRIPAARLRARLAECLRQVRRGRHYVVTEGGTPVARLVPWWDGVESPGVGRRTRRRRSIQDVRLPPPLTLDVDPVALLLEERQGGR